jgi:CheY-like chemotaxis protein
MTMNNEIEILLVEDNPNDAELAIRALKTHNLANKLVWVKDGAAALEQIFGAGGEGLESGSPMPRLILLDLKMPKVDGLEVLRRIKGDERTKIIPVVVLTSSHEEIDVVKSYRLGVNSYLVKPVDFHEFTDVVKQLGMYWLLLNKPSTPG